jgi:transposase
MGYRMLKIDHLYEVYRRVVAGESKRSIANQTGWDRKTIGKYVGILTERALLPTDEPIAREEFQSRAVDLADQPREKSTPARDQLLDHLDELRDLIAPPKDENGRTEKPMRAKSAYRVILRRHNLSIGYSSFKRFARSHGLMDVAKKTYIRIELPPGREIQLDYGSMGLMAVDGQNRTIYAFCAILAHSRKPFVQLVTSQNEQSFAASVVEMLHFYGGVPEFLTVDNLKAAVVKPDLWDPQLNRSLAEVSEYYGTFINAARVETPTDKGKVERIVPVVREAYRVLRTVHPTASLTEMNRYMLEWCVNDYGTTPHGTTHIPPEEAFITERNALKSLPEARFEPAVWKTAKVHSGDGFLTYNKMRFAVPAKYRGKTGGCPRHQPPDRDFLRYRAYPWVSLRAGNACVLLQERLSRGKAGDVGWLLPTTPSPASEIVRECGAGPDFCNPRASCVPQCPPGAGIIADYGRFPRSSGLRCPLSDRPPSPNRGSQDVQSTL